jgi:hypothetical protein
MGAEKFMFCVGRTKEGEEILKRKTQTFRTYVTNHVCEDCNHGWMSALEGWFLEAYGLLVEPKWPILADTIIEQGLREERRLFQWLLKTAVTSEQNSFMRNRVIPEPLRPLAKDGNLSPAFWIDLGYSKLRTVALFLTKGFPVHNGKYFFPAQTHQDGFSFTLQLNHLLLRLVHAPGADVRKGAPKTLSSNLLLPQNSYREYANVNEFIHSLYLRTWLGKK